GQNISAAQRQKLTRILNRDPTLPDREAATLAGVSKATANRVRKGLEESGLLPATYRRNGSSRRALERPMRVEVRSLAGFVDLLPDIASIIARDHGGVAPTAIWLRFSVSLGDQLWYREAWSEDVDEFVRRCGRTPKVTPSRLYSRGH
ncbi:MAG: hypothetical protein ABI352_12390, partial [Candidatus Dormibacter sp.]